MKLAERGLLNVVLVMALSVTFTGVSRAAEDSPTILDNGTVKLGVIDVSTRFPGSGMKIGTMCA